MASQHITISARVSAPTDKVWRYYTQPEHITQWNFAADTWHCPSASNDVVVGGRYCARMEAKDGSFGFDFEGIYNEVDTQKKLAFTMADGRRVIIQFRSEAHHTEVVVTFDAEEENSIELQRDGWQAILNNFKQYTEAH